MREITFELFLKFVSHIFINVSANRLVRHLELSAKLDRQIFHSEERDQSFPVGAVKVKPLTCLLL